MIDVEVKVFNRVYDSVAPLCAKNKFVSTEIVDMPTAFPAACLVEKTNVTVRARQSSTPIENFARIMYQFDGYATTKAKCRELYAAADSAMISMNFTRVGGEYLFHPDNLNVFRYTARYEAIVDTEGNLYRV